MRQQLKQEIEYAIYEFTHSEGFIKFLAASTVIVGTVLTGFILGWLFLTLTGGIS